MKVIELYTLDQIEKALTQDFDFCSFDIETNAKNPYLEIDLFEITCISFAFDLQTTYALPVNCSDYTLDQTVFKRFLDLFFERVIYNRKVNLIAHNIKADLGFLLPYGLDFDKVKGRFYDTMSLHHLLDEDSAQGLKPLVNRYLPQYAGYDDAIKGKAWDKLTKQELIDYNSLDVYLTFVLKVFIIERLYEKDPLLMRYYFNISEGLIWVTFRMELNGIPLDIVGLEKAKIEAKINIDIEHKKLLAYPEVQRYIMNIRRRKKDAEIKRLKLKAVEVDTEYKTKVIESKSKYNVNDSDAKENNPLKSSVGLFGQVQQTKEGLKEREKLKKKLNKRLESLKNGRNNKLKEIKRKIQTVKEQGIDYDLNFSSTQQVGALLYGHSDFNRPLGFGFPTPMVKGERKQATGKEYLLKLVHPFAKHLITYRKRVKLLTHYLEKLGHSADRSKGVYRDRFNEIGTKTGRISSYCHTFPKKDMDGIYTPVKTLFVVPSEDYVLVQWDYSQAELRIIAEIADEKVMQKVYREDKDIHINTGVSMAEITEEQFYKLDEKERKEIRKNAKPVNFGLCYQMGENTLKSVAFNDYGMTWTDKETKHYHSRYYQTYPALPKWHKDAIKQARHTGRSKTLFGRYRSYKNINDEGKSFKRGLDERAAINMPIQGTAGEFTNLSLILLNKYLPKEVILYNSVHDSIKAAVLKTQFKEVALKAKNIMENLPTHLLFNFELQKVKMKVDIEVSQHNEATLKDYKI